MNSNDKKKMLFITTSWDISLSNGATIATNNILEALSRNYDVDVIRFSDTDNYDSNLSSVKVIANIIKNSWKKSFIISLKNIIPLSIARYYKREIIDLINNNITYYDVVFVDHLHPTYCYKKSLAFKNKKIKKILFEHNIEFCIWKDYALKCAFPFNFFSFFQYIFMKQYEINNIEYFDKVFAISDKEKDMLNNHLRKSNATLDVETLAISPFPPLDQQRGNIKDPDMVLFVGSFSWFPNIDAMDWFLSDCWPEIIRKRPHTKLTIVGNKSDEYLRSKWAGVANVYATGFVEDLEVYYEKASVFVLPMRLGAGIKIKLLEAASHDLPIVTTRNGAEGVFEINDKTGKCEYCLIADNSNDLNMHIIKVLDTNVNFKEMSKKRVDMLEKRRDSFLETIDNIQALLKRTLKIATNPELLFHYGFKVDVRLKGNAFVLFRDL